MIHLRRPLHLALVGLAACLPTIPANAQDALVDDATFTVDGTTDGGGYVSLSSIESTAMVGGDSLGFDTSNTGEEAGEYALAYRRFDPILLEVGGSLTLSFTVTNLGDGFGTIRSFGFGFVGPSEGGLPDADLPSALTDRDEYYSIVGVLTGGERAGQFLVSGVRSKYHGDTGSPLQTGGVDGSKAGSTGGGVAPACGVSLRIVRVEDSEEGKPTYDTTLTILRPNGTTDDKGTYPLTSKGSDTDYNTWDGIVIGATGVFPKGENVSFEIDNVVVKHEVGG